MATRFPLAPGIPTITRNDKSEMHLPPDGPVRAGGGVIRLTVTQPNGKYADVLFGASVLKKDGTAYSFYHLAADIGTRHKNKKRPPKIENRLQIIVHASNPAGMSIAAAVRHAFACGETDREETAKIAQMSLKPLEAPQRKDMKLSRGGLRDAQPL